MLCSGYCFVVVVVCLYVYLFVVVVVGVVVVLGCWFCCCWWLFFVVFCLFLCLFWGGVVSFCCCCFAPGLLFSYICFFLQGDQNKSMIQLIRLVGFTFLGFGVILTSLQILNPLNWDDEYIIDPHS